MNDFLIKRKSRETRRRLFLLVVLLVCTISLLFGSTYAWVTSNEASGISNIALDIKSFDGLLVSADAENWRTVVSKNDLIGNTNNNSNQIPNVLGYVSSAGELNDKNLPRMFLGKVEKKCSNEGSDDENKVCDNPIYLLTTTEQNEIRCYDAGCFNQNAYFVAFDLYLKVDSNDVPLYLTSNAGVTVKKEHENIGLKNTTRVAFVVEDFISKTDYENENGVNTITSAASRAENVIIWEPNSDSHTAFGARLAKRYYGFEPKIGSNAPYISYDGVAAPISNGVELNKANSSFYTDYFKQVTPNIITNASSAKTPTGITLNAGVTKVRVYFWVEGQDVDTENNVIGTDINLNLEFSIE